MLIGVKNRFVFIANSKTASTSIESVLLPYAEIQYGGTPERKHMDWRSVRKMYAFLFNFPRFKPESFFRFGVVREPADWVLSWYKYRRGINPELPGHLTEMTFEQFWQSDDWTKTLLQRNKFIDEDGECRFDLIIPYEQIGEIMPAVFARLAMKKASMPVKNKSAGKSLARDSIPPALADEINTYYQQDFDFWMEWREKARAFAASVPEEVAVAPKAMVKNKAQAQARRRRLNKG